VKGTLAPNDAKEATSSDEGLDSSGGMISGKRDFEYGADGARDLLWARREG
jgi:hypothetical protein